MAVEADARSPELFLGGLGVGNLCLCEFKKGVVCEILVSLFLLAGT